MESRNFFILLHWERKIASKTLYFFGSTANQIHSQDFSHHGLSTAFPVRISAMNTYTGRFRYSANKLNLYTTI